MALVIAMQDGVLVARGGARWQTREVLAGRRCRCLAADPSGLLYCGTDHGLWRSTDAGDSWGRTGAGIDHDRVTAVAIGDGENGSGTVGVVYAGTEPSAVYRSRDGGERWEPLDGLLDLPSSDGWSFPPRPGTHHVRWIAPDPLVAGRLFVAIEAGALVRSDDAGRSWHDRSPDGPLDTHTLVVHPRARDRLYAAAGDGWFESRDGGRSWRKPEAGLRHRYAWSCVADPEDPDTAIVSAADGPRQAHDAAHAESFIYRRTGGQPWAQVRAGLPQPAGSTVSVLASDPDERAVVYAANNRGVFRSADMGQSWEALDIEWPDRFRRQRATGLEVIRDTG